MHKSIPQELVPVKIASRNKSFQQCEHSTGIVPRNRGMPAAGRVLSRESIPQEEYQIEWALRRKGFSKQGRLPHHERVASRGSIHRKSPQQCEHPAGRINSRVSIPQKESPVERKSRRKSSHSREHPVGRVPSSVRTPGNNHRTEVPAEDQHSQIPKLFHALHEDDWDRRMEFCGKMNEMIQINENLPNRIMWTDEAIFKLNDHPITQTLLEHFSMKSSLTNGWGAMDPFIGLRGHLILLRQIFLWGYLKDKVYNRKPKSLEQMKFAIKEVSNLLDADL
ncbi:hypothetical protein LAZ67_9001391 [Cordylochernes scorpioides]|uniref:Uncharacterized protein n=1 Tax=Cordylochernes scorpioides TaxID=51811 RepID=A0ABY6KXY9_9ARAC|nr:hypothetical protein LAZ67_9001391 [Cordylochernes scorpioides]